MNNGDEGFWKPEITSSPFICYGVIVLLIVRLYSISYNKGYYITPFARW